MIWKSGLRSHRDRRRDRIEPVMRRSCRPERLEPRRLLAVDPLEAGAPNLESVSMELAQEPQAGALEATLRTPVDRGILDNRSNRSPRVEVLGMTQRPSHMEDIATQVQLVAFATPVGIVTSLDPYRMLWDPRDEWERGEHGGQWFIDLNGNGRWDEGDLRIEIGTELNHSVVEDSVVEDSVVEDRDGDATEGIAIIARQPQRDFQRTDRDPGQRDPQSHRHTMADRGNTETHREPGGKQVQRLPALPSLQGLHRRGSDRPLRAEVVDHVLQLSHAIDVPMASEGKGEAEQEPGCDDSGS